MDTGSVLDIAKEYAEIVGRSLAVEKILLFGSHAIGTAKDHSDIDIAVIVKTIEGDYLEQQVNLYKLRRSVDLRIEPVLLAIDEGHSGFLEEVTTTGQVVFSSS